LLREPFNGTPSKYKLIFMSEEFELLLQMKRTTKLILLLVGFVAGSCILQLAIVVSNFHPENIQEYVKGERFVSPDTLWAVIKPTAFPVPTDGDIDRQVED
jgi:hypothetical protein